MDEPKEIDQKEQIEALLAGVDGTPWPILILFGSNRPLFRPNRPLVFAAGTQTAPRCPKNNPFLRLANKETE